jgi:hypothetical protein
LKPVRSSSIEIKLDSISKPDHDTRKSISFDWFVFS